MTLDQFNAAFVYKADGKLDSWRVLRTSDPRGDCDDYAITVAHIEAGGWLALLWGLLTFRFVPWFVWSENRVSHVALWVRGKGWIDNWYPYYSRTLRHKKRFPAFLPLIILKLIGGIFIK